MTLVYRDFDKPTNHWGNIQIYATYNNTLSIIVFGIHDKYRDEGNQRRMLLKYPEYSDLYKIITLLLEALTNNYENRTKHGYIDSIFNQDNCAEKDIWDFSRYDGVPTLQFTKENMKHLTFHEPFFEEERDKDLIFFEMTDDGIFIHNDSIIDFTTLMKKCKRKTH